MIWWYCKHHCHVEADTTIVVIFLTLLMADFNRQWASPSCTHTCMSECKVSPPACPLLSVCPETLFQASRLCLAPVCSRRCLDLSFLQASGSGVLVPWQLFQASNSQQWGATMPACHPGHQMVAKAPEREALVALLVCQALTPHSCSYGPRSCDVQARAKW